MRSSKPRLSRRRIFLGHCFLAAAFVSMGLMNPLAALEDPEDSEDGEGVDAGPLRAWFERQRDVRSIDAAFRQERILRTVKRPITAEGRFRFSAPDRFRWEIGTDNGEDRPEVVAVQNGPDRLVVVEEKKKTATVFDLTDPQLREKVQRMGFARPGLEGSFDLFDKTFRLVSLVTEDGVLRAEMKFRERRAALAVFKVTMEIDVATDQIREFGLWFRDNSRVRLVFGDVWVNRPMEEGIFEVELEGYAVEEGQP